MDCENCAWHELKTDEATGKSNEVCGYAGYRFWPGLEPAERCFDAMNEEQKKSVYNAPVSVEQLRKRWIDIVDTNHKAWAATRKCKTCAFFGFAGAKYDAENMSRKGDSISIHYDSRCRGYYNNLEEEPQGLCCSYLTMDQCAATQQTPIQGGERIALWNKFREENNKKTEE